MLFTVEGLTALAGIGRKLVNVIMSEAGAKAKGTMIDLHLLKVTRKFDISTRTDSKKNKAHIPEILP